MCSVSQLHVSYNIFFLLLFSLHTYCIEQQPTLTVIFVIDQCPFYIIRTLRPYMHGGIKEIYENGINYMNAHHPHSTTASGHTGFNTGAFPNKHGIIGNGWYNQKQKKVACDEDNRATSAVFAPDGVYAFGKSPHHIMVDGISDQFVLQSSAAIPHHAVSISNKSRAAIGTANRTQAFWFDNQSGQLTSSKAYFDELPAWVHAFNKEYAVSPSQTFEWKQQYDDAAGAYAFPYIDDYRFTRKKKLINSTIIIGQEHKKNPYDLFELSPYSNSFILDAAYACIQEHVGADKSDRLLLWVCLSSLDKVGHRFGPYSREYIDTVYHLDNAIGSFMQRISALLEKDATLFVLTSDHGTSPILEYLHEKGLHDIGTLINPQKLVKELNEFIEKTYNINNCIRATTNQQIYINKYRLQELSAQERKTLIQDIQHFLEMVPGIQKAWTPHELLTRSFPPHSMEFCFQQQLYPGRSGNIILQFHPFSLIMNHKYGMSHQTPHTHNTHVPLILYQTNTTQPKKVYTRVSTLQLANTLSYLLGVPQPSSSYMEVLPQAFNP